MASDDEIENVIRKNIPWAKLTDELRILLGSSQREYEKRVLDFSIKNQLSYKDNIGMCCFMEGPASLTPHCSYL